MAFFNKSKRSNKGQSNFINWNEGSTIVDNIAEYKRKPERTFYAYIEYEDSEKLFKYESKFRSVARKWAEQDAKLHHGKVNLFGAFSN